MPHGRFPLRPDSTVNDCWNISLATAVMQPLVTVLIPAFNAEHTIARAIRSALAQDYPALEILVIDDASRDATREVVARFVDARIRLVPLPQNLGVCGAINAGLAIARGEFVAFLDADDEWLPGKIRKQVAVIGVRPDMSFVTCGCIFVGPNGKTQRIDDLDPPPVPETERWRSYLATSYVAKPCVLARRSVLAAVGPFDEQLRIAEDQDMWIRLALAGPVGHVHEALTMAHDTEDSLTKRYAPREAEFLLPMIRKHLAAQAHRLSRGERRRILGQRHCTIGRNLYSVGERRQGIRHLVVASLLGCRPFSNAWYLVTASGPAAWVKRMLRGSDRVRA